MGGEAAAFGVGGAGGGFAGAVLEVDGRGWDGGGEVAGEVGVVRLEGAGYGGGGGALALLWGLD